MKQCTSCKEIKEEKYFSKNKRCKDGLEIYCRLCRRERNKKTKSYKAMRIVRLQSDPNGDGISVIFLPNNKIALVDEENYSEIAQFRWCLNTNGYPIRTENGQTTLMSRQIMNPPEDMYVDHIDGEPLNNKRDNLRICTNSQNQQHRVKLTSTSTSGYHGVSFYKSTCKWVSRIMTNGKRICLGYFDTIEEAIEARKEAEIKYHGNYKQTITV
jgi:hypothetical protein